MTPISNPILFDGVSLHATGIEAINVRLVMASKNQRQRV